MEGYRRQRFAEGSIRCDVSGKELREDEAHIDHAPPWTFDAIVRAYQEEFGDPALRHDGTCDLFQDSTDAERFKTFHDQRAKLRLVHKHVNISDLRRRQHRS
jgi:hypothetical protein